MQTRITQPCNCSRRFFYDCSVDVYIFSGLIINYRQRQTDLENFVNGVGAEQIETAVVFHQCIRAVGRADSEGAILEAEYSSDGVTHVLVNTSAFHSKETASSRRRMQRLQVEISIGGSGGCLSTESRRKCGQ